MTRRAQATTAQDCQAERQIKSRQSWVESVALADASLGLGGYLGSYVSPKEQAYGQFYLDRLTPDVRAAFWSRVTKAAGCWLWSGASNGQSYGIFRVRCLGKRTAHRLAWELTHDLYIPKRLYACHHCDNPPCVNPDHIYPATQKRNLDDAALRGRAHRTGCETAEEWREYRLVYERHNFENRWKAGDRAGALKALARLRKADVFELARSVMGIDPAPRQTRQALLAELETGHA